MNAYCRYLEAKEILEEAEKSLWNLNGNSTNLQHVFDLWSFEAKRAEEGQKKLKQELRQTKRVTNHKWNRSSRIL